MQTHKRFHPHGGRRRRCIRLRAIAKVTRFARRMPTSLQMCRWTSRLWLEELPDGEMPSLHCGTPTPPTSQQDVVVSVNGGTPSLSSFAGEYRPSDGDVESVHAPALKCGVTANIALQASYALWAVAPFSGAVGRGGLAASCAHDVRLQAVTNVSRFARLMRRRDAVVTFCLKPLIYLTPAGC